MDVTLSKCQKIPRTQENLSKYLFNKIDKNKIVKIAKRDFNNFLELKGLELLNLCKILIKKNKTINYRKIARKF